MDTVRPNKTENPQITCNDQGAVYFDFLITLKNDSPLQGMHFIAFASDELGLNVSTTLGEEIFTALYRDDEQNWYCLMLAYAYTKIYKKICWLTKLQPSTSGALAFAEHAQRLIRFTAFGNDISLSAGPKEWAALRNCVITPMAH